VNGGYCDIASASFTRASSVASNTRFANASSAAVSREMIQGLTAV
jgi:hypothetical protein